MYLTSHPLTYYDRSGEQHASRALFLLLVPDPSGPGLRALVRKVALSQCGNWMMGRANINGHWYTVSGSYGGDGLPMRGVRPEDVQDHGLPLPQDLYDLWNNGGGHNSAGSEAAALRAWALANLKALRR